MNINEIKDYNNTNIRSKTDDDSVTPDVVATAIDQVADFAAANTAGSSNTGVTPGSGLQLTDGTIELGGQLTHYFNQILMNGCMFTMRQDTNFAQRGPGLYLADGTSELLQIDGAGKYNAVSIRDGEIHLLASGSNAMIITLTDLNIRALSNSNSSYFLQADGAGNITSAPVPVYGSGLQSVDYTIPTDGLTEVYIPGLANKTFVALLMGNAAYNPSSGVTLNVPAPGYLNSTAIGGFTNAGTIITVLFKN